jgi:hypothetical protein
MLIMGESKNVKIRLRAVARTNAFSDTVAVQFKIGSLTNQKQPH